MKKLFYVLTVATLFAITLTGCYSNEEYSYTPEPEVEEGIDLETPDFGMEGGMDIELNDVRVFLLAHSPESNLEDGSFNQGAWNGIQDFVAMNPGAEYQFMQPVDASDESRLNLIESAVEAGANVIVLPGIHFRVPLYTAQDMFPETMFVILDSSPAHPETDEVRIESNVVAIHYAEEEAGFLAGFAAVIEGYRNLGFMGGHSVPAVVRFGHGFIQGAEYAAYQLGLSAGDVEVNHMFLGGFMPDVAHTTTAASWFEAGTEVIFVAAGGAATSVMAAADAAGASVIGVDVDQSHMSDSVVTSALKGLDISVQNVLVDFLFGHFNGGAVMRFDTTNQGVSLAMANSRMQNFGEYQFEEIFQELANGLVVASPTLDMNEIEVELVVVNAFE